MKKENFKEKNEKTEKIVTKKYNACLFFKLNL